MKYPDNFISSDAIILNRIHLVVFDRKFFYNSFRTLNWTAPVFEISCRTGEALPAWTEWLLTSRNTARPVSLASIDKPVQ
jgi:hydrogenase nickel incorporation protein HypB